MGCCTAFAHFCRTVGVDRFLAPQPALHFVTPDRRVSRFRADPWPAPLHLGRALASAHYLTAAEKARVAVGLLALARESPDADPPLLEWLQRHRQTAGTVERFWGVILTSALNETVDRLGLKYARKVFLDGFLRTRGGHVVQVPTVPLGRLYGNELRAWLARHNVVVREGAHVTRLAVRPPAARGVQVESVVLRDGSRLSAESYVLAVPFDRVTELLPPELAADPSFAAAKSLTPSPITSVHLWFDRPVMALPHAVLVGCLGQWVFDRGDGSVQVVVSAARQLRELGRDELQRRIAEELGRLFPRVRLANLLRSKVVTEPAATFSAVPGVDRVRPAQRTPVSNLMLAGDWTATGWPATMEGAVRSGYLAADSIARDAGGVAANHDL
jgi:squalene-associated FAD-dependent desaturase